MSDLSSIFYRHADNVDVYTMDSSSFAEACREAVAAGLIEGGTTFNPTGFVVDLKGRIYMNGFLVGFLNKDCGVNELRDFVGAMGQSLPYYDEVAKMVEEADGA